MHKCIFFSQIHVLNRGWKKIVLNCFILLHFASRIEYTWAMSNEHWTCTLNKQLLTLQMLTTISIKYICFQQTSHAFTSSKAESKSRISASVCFLILLLLLPWNLCLNRVKHSALGIVFFFHFPKSIDEQKNESFECLKSGIFDNFPWYLSSRVWPIRAQNVLRKFINAFECFYIIEIVYIK